MEAIWIYLSAVAGCFLGVVITCACQAAKESDEKRYADGADWEENPCLHCECGWADGRNHCSEFCEDWNRYQKQESRRADTCQ